MCGLLDPPLFPSFLETTSTMSKAILSTLAATLLCAAASTANAADGISSSTLAEMGLSGLAVMSDSEALAVRGKGFVGCGLCGHRSSVEPSSVAFGNSFATISLGDACPECGPEGTSHSENGYAAEGPFAASGENFSEAGAEVTHIETVVVDDHRVLKFK
jgi:hypothetical protein